MAEHARCHVWTIQEILADPRYREFATAVTECGRQVVPGGFPWRLMGKTDLEILGMPLLFRDGLPMTENDKIDAIGVVRAQERLVVEYWNWWLGWEWLTQRHETKLEPVAAAPKAAAGFLF